MPPVPSVNAAAMLAVGVPSWVAVATGNDHAELIQGNVTLTSSTLPAVGSQCAGGDWTYISGAYRVDGIISVSENGNPRVVALMTTSGCR